MLFIYVFTMMWVSEINCATTTVDPSAGRPSTSATATSTSPPLHAADKTPSRQPVPEAPKPNLINRSLGSTSSVAYEVAGNAVADYSTPTDIVVETGTTTLGNAKVQHTTQTNIVDPPILGNAIVEHASSTGFGMTTKLPVLANEHTTVSRKVGSTTTFPTPEGSPVSPLSNMVSTQGTTVRPIGFDPLLAPLTQTQIKSGVGMPKETTIPKPKAENTVEQGTGQSNKIANNPVPTSHDVTISLLPGSETSTPEQTTQGKLQQTSTTMPATQGANGQELLGGGAAHSTSVTTGRNSFETTLVAQGASETIPTSTVKIIPAHDGTSPLRTGVQISQVAIGQDSHGTTTPTPRGTVDASTTGMTSQNQASNVQLETSAHTAGGTTGLNVPEASTTEKVQGTPEQNLLTTTQIAQGADVGTHTHNSNVQHQLETASHLAQGTTKQNLPEATTHKKMQAELNIGSTTTMAEGTTENILGIGTSQNGQATNVNGQDALQQTNSQNVTDVSATQRSQVTPDQTIGTTSTLQTITLQHAQTTNIQGTSSNMEQGTNSQNPLVAPTSTMTTQLTTEQTNGTKTSMTQGTTDGLVNIVGPPSQIAEGKTGQNSPVIASQKVQVNTEQNIGTTAPMAHRSIPKYVQPPTLEPLGKSSNTAQEITTPNLPAATTEKTLGNTGQNIETTTPLTPRGTELTTLGSITALQAQEQLSTNLLGPVISEVGITPGGTSGTTQVVQGTTDANIIGTKTVQGAQGSTPRTNEMVQNTTGGTVTLQTAEGGIQSSTGNIQLSQGSADANIIGTKTAQNAQGNTQGTNELVQNTTDGTVTLQGGIQSSTGSFQLSQGTADANIIGTNTAQNAQGPSQGTNEMVQNTTDGTVTLQNALGGIQSSPRNIQLSQGTADANIIGTKTAQNALRNTQATNEMVQNTTGGTVTLQNDQGGIQSSTHNIQLSQGSADANIIGTNTAQNAHGPSQGTNEMVQNTTGGTVTLQNSQGGIQSSNHNIQLSQGTADVNLLGTNSLGKKTQATNQANSVVTPIPMGLGTTEPTLSLLTTINPQGTSGQTVSTTSPTPTVLKTNLDPVSLADGIKPLAMETPSASPCDNYICSTIAPHCVLVQQKCNTSQCPVGPECSDNAPNKNWCSSGLLVLDQLFQQITCNPTVHNSCPEQSVCDGSRGVHKCCWIGTSGAPVSNSPVDQSATTNLKGPSENGGSGLPFQQDARSSHSIAEASNGQIQPSSLNPSQGNTASIDKATSMSTNVADSANQKSTSLFGPQAKTVIQSNLKTLNNVDQSVPKAVGSIDPPQLPPGEILTGQGSSTGTNQLVHGTPDSNSIRTMTSQNAQGNIQGSNAVNQPMPKQISQLDPKLPASVNHQLIGKSKTTNTNVAGESLVNPNVPIHSVMPTENLVNVQTMPKKNAVPPQNAVNGQSVSLKTNVAGHSPLKPLDASLPAQLETPAVSPQNAVNGQSVSLNTNVAGHSPLKPLDASLPAQLETPAVSPQNAVNGQSVSLNTNVAGQTPLKPLDASLPAQLETPAVSPQNAVNGESVSLNTNVAGHSPLKPLDASLPAQLETPAVSPQNAVNGQSVSMNTNVAGHSPLKPLDASLPAQLETPAVSPQNAVNGQSVSLNTNVAGHSPLKPLDASLPAQLETPAVSPQNAVNGQSVSLNTNVAGHSPLKPLDASLPAQLETPAVSPQNAVNGLSVSLNTNVAGHSPLKPLDASLPAQLETPAVSPQNAVNGLSMSLNTNVAGHSPLKPLDASLPAQLETPAVSPQNAVNGQSVSLNTNVAAHSPLKPLDASLPAQLETPAVSPQNAVNGQSVSLNTNVAGHSPLKPLDASLPAQLETPAVSPQNAVNGQSVSLNTNVAGHSPLKPLDASLPAQLETPAVSPQNAVNGLSVSLNTNVAGHSPLKPLDASLPAQLETPAVSPQNAVNGQSVSLNTNVAGHSPLKPLDASLPAQLETPAVSRQNAVNGQSVSLNTNVAGHSPLKPLDASLPAQLDTTAVSPQNAVNGQSVSLNTNVADHSPLKPLDSSLPAQLETPAVSPQNAVNGQSVSLNTNVAAHSPLKPLDASLPAQLDTPAVSPQNAVNGQSESLNTNVAGHSPLKPLDASLPAQLETPAVSPQNAVNGQSVSLNTNVAGHSPLKPLDASLPAQLEIPAVSPQNAVNGQSVSLNTNVAGHSPLKPLDASLPTQLETPAVPPQNAVIGQSVSLNTNVAGHSPLKPLDASLPAQLETPAVSPQNAVNGQSVSLNTNVAGHSPLKPLDASLPAHLETPAVSPQNAVNGQSVSLNTNVAGHSPLKPLDASLPAQLDTPAVSPQNAVNGQSVSLNTNVAGHSPLKPLDASLPAQLDTPAVSPQNAVNGQSVSLNTNVAGHSPLKPLDASLPTQLEIPAVSPQNAVNGQSVSLNTNVAGHSPLKPSDASLPAQLEIPAVSPQNAVNGQSVSLNTNVAGHSPLKPSDASLPAQLETPAVSPQNAVNGQSVSLNTNVAGHSPLKPSDASLPAQLETPAVSPQNAVNGQSVSLNTNVAGHSPLKPLDASLPTQLETPAVSPQNAVNGQSVSLNTNVAGHSPLKPSDASQPAQLETPAVSPQNAVNGQSVSLNTNVASHSPLKPLDASLPAQLETPAVSPQNAGNGQSVSLNTNVAGHSPLKPLDASLPAQLETKISGDVQTSGITSNNFGVNTKQPGAGPDFSSLQAEFPSNNQRLSSNTLGGPVLIRNSGQQRVQMAPTPYSQTKHNDNMIPQSFQTQGGHFGTYRPGDIIIDIPTAGSTKNHATITGVTETGVIHLGTHSLDSRGHPAASTLHTPPEPPAQGPDGVRTHNHKNLKNILTTAGASIMNNIQTLPAEPTLPLKSGTSILPENIASRTSMKSAVNDIPPTSKTSVSFTSTVGDIQSNGPQNVGNANKHASVVGPTERNANIQDPALRPTIHTDVISPIGPAASHMNPVYANEKIIAPSVLQSGYMQDGPGVPLSGNIQHQPAGSSIYPDQGTVISKHNQGFPASPLTLTGQAHSQKSQTFGSPILRSNMVQHDPKHVPSMPDAHNQQGFYQHGKSMGSTKYAGSDVQGGQSFGSLGKSPQGDRLLGYNSLGAEGIQSGQIKHRSNPVGLGGQTVLRKNTQSIVKENNHVGLSTVPSGLVTKNGQTNQLGRNHKSRQAYQLDTGSGPNYHSTIQETGRIQTKQNTNSVSSMVPSSPGHSMGSSLPEHAYIPPGTTVGSAISRPSNGVPGPTIGQTLPVVNQRPNVGAPIQAHASTFKHPRPKSKMGSSVQRSASIHTGPTASTLAIDPAISGSLRGAPTNELPIPRVDRMHKVPATRAFQKDTLSKQGLKRATKPRMSFVENTQTKLDAHPHPPLGQSKPYIKNISSQKKKLMSLKNTHHRTRIQTMVHVKPHGNGHNITKTIKITSPRSNKRNLPITVKSNVFRQTPVTYKDHLGQTRKAPAYGVAISTTVGKHVTKPGFCYKPCGLGVCANECIHDGHCPGLKKCCHTGCGHVCTDPLPVLPAAKPGTCPIPMQIKSCPNVRKCNQDSQCPGSSKCCCISSGCRVCVPQRNLLPSQPITHSKKTTVSTSENKTDVTTHISSTIITKNRPVRHKPGFCHLPCGSFQCTQECSNDGHCPGKSKCCNTGCGRVCSSPLQRIPRTKGGHCPARDPNRVCPQVPHCRHDYECPGSAKCCCIGPRCRVCVTQGSPLYMMSGGFIPALPFLK